MSTLCYNVKQIQKKEVENMVLAKIFAVIIFLAMFFLIVTEKFERQWTTLVAGAATIIVVFLACMRSFAAVWRSLNIRTLFTLGFWYGGGEQTTGQPLSS